MDVKDFIQQFDELKGIDIDNIINFMEDCKQLNPTILNGEEEKFKLKDGEKVLKESKKLEQYFEDREAHKEEILEKRKAEKDNKLLDFHNAISHLYEFNDDLGRLLSNYENNEEENLLIKTIEEDLGNMKEKMASLILKITEGDKELARKFFLNF